MSKSKFQTEILQSYNLGQIRVVLYLMLNKKAHF